MQPVLPTTTSDEGAVQRQVLQHFDAHLRSVAFVKPKRGKTYALCLQVLKDLATRAPLPGSIVFAATTSHLSQCQMIMLWSVLSRDPRCTMEYRRARGFTFRFLGHRINVIGATQHQRDLILGYSWFYIDDAKYIEPQFIATVLQRNPVILRAVSSCHSGTGRLFDNVLSSANEEEEARFVADAQAANPFTAAQAEFFACGR